MGDECNFDYKSIETKKIWMGSVVGLLGFISSFVKRLQFESSLGNA